eukprot:1552640-Pleurochrysis_carterae.AAC.5
MPEAAPSTIGALTSGAVYVILISRLIPYRMRTICEWLRHTNARYGCAGQRAAASLSRKAARPDRAWSR